MTLYLIGYLVIAVILIVTVNYMVRNADKKKMDQSQQPAARDAERQSELESSFVEEEQEKLEEAEALLDESDPQSVVTQAVASSNPPKTDQALEDETPLEQAGTKPAVDPYQFEGGRGKIIVTMMIGAFVAILNQTLLNIAIPHIMNDLNVSASTVQWLSTGYMLTNGIFIPITAFLIARLGTRKLFISAVTAFTIGSIICALSTTFSILMLGRVVQAAGAGVMMPLLMTVFLTIYPPEKRGAAMGMFGVAVLFAPAIGPTLSGWLIGHYDWHVLFDIVIPFGIAALVMAYFWMIDVTEITKPKFDTWGFIFSTIGLGFLLYGFSEAGNNGWDSAIVLVTLVIGVIGIIAFITHELTTEQPMLELRVFKYDIFALTTIIGSIINMAMFAAMLLLPIYLQNIRGFSALDSGLLMLPGAIVMAIMLPISGKLFDKYGARWLAVFGLAITVLTTWGFTTLNMSTSYGFIMVLYVLRMFGMSFLSMTVTTEGMNQLPTRLAGHGTAASNTARTVAGSIGTAFLITVMTTRSAFHSGTYSNVLTTSNGYLTSKLSELGTGISSMAGLPVEQGQGLATSLLYEEAMKRATVNGINDAFIVATGIALVAFILAFFIKRARPSDAKEK
ncbi:MFS transporter [Sporosarcina sp. BI001-red]|uniref:DHA2 family efflux MFS transporter permease subunit n=1 Tax=Sporosarcina sp. BI001-red TaxID=2282866 RepID=UPI000E2816B4|nr:DHA2 family efflux MFS transporter permease subunit [Sporosarcina sp. BI001-red]REB08718.1 MFS transporter [Sporosarcina sp. BI001-red]